MSCRSTRAIPARASVYPDRGTKYPARQLVQGRVNQHRSHNVSKRHAGRRHLANVRRCVDVGPSRSLSLQYSNVVDRGEYRDSSIANRRVKHRDRLRGGPALRAAGIEENADHKHARVFTASPDGAGRRPAAHLLPPLPPFLRFSVCNRFSLPSVVSPRPSVTSEKTMATAFSRRNRCRLPSGRSADIVRAHVIGQIVLALAIGHAVAVVGQVPRDPGAPRDGPAARENVAIPPFIARGRVVAADGRRCVACACPFKAASDPNPRPATMRGASS